MKNSNFVAVILDGPFKTGFSGTQWYFVIPGTLRVPWPGQNRDHRESSSVHRNMKSAFPSTIYVENGNSRKVHFSSSENRSFDWLRDKTFFALFYLIDFERGNVKPDSSFLTSYDNNT